MLNDFRTRTIIASIGVAVVFSQLTYSVYAETRQKSWLERLGVLNYEPLVYSYKDYKDASMRNLSDGPLLPFLPTSAKDIYAVESQFLDLAIAEYEFDQSDWTFFKNEWEEMDDSSFKDAHLDHIKTCPWKEPPSQHARFFRSTNIKSWNLSAYVIIDEERLKAWHYWSVPKPAKQSFCL